MTPSQLRQALHELNGQRDLAVVFVQMGSEMAECRVPHAMLIPDEADHLIKVTDGKHVFILDAERIAWIRIG
ncbi:MAG TPA: hypothetical protein VD963_09295 [Phycisphaerales bacterium]|nr:hypothetical protein [Phycisphaerales bacterium]